MPGAARSFVQPDGTTVELNGESQIAPNFTPAVRRVRLLRGEAHFIVTKDAARSFIVSVDGVEVRAVGAAFNVRRGSAAVEVLVTVCSVQVEGYVAGAPVAASPVEAGQRAVVTMPSRTTTPERAPLRWLDGGGDPLTKCQQHDTDDMRDRPRFFQNIIQAKGRNVGTGIVSVYFRRDVTRFEEIQK
jgi:ferric-dicitrate binding protein FerR (iron transport regulator)